jgi:hypothetical protein
MRLKPGPSSSNFCESPESIGVSPLSYAHAPMQAYALVSAIAPDEAADVFLRREDSLVVSVILALAS